MRLELSMVEVDGSVFISGTNLGPKIDTDHKGGCKLYYDTDLKLDVIIHKGKVALVNGKSRILKNPADIGVELVPDRKQQVVIYERDYTQQPVKAQATGPERTLRTAQVETPIQKVQGTPGRKAKYQGEVIE